MFKKILSLALVLSSLLSIPVAAEAAPLPPVDKPAEVWVVAVVLMWEEPGEIGAVVATVPYVYADANWPDKLTSYDGKAITYDAIGNPLTYDGWTFTWEGGRQLKHMVKGNAAYLNFYYNDEGFRTRKINLMGQYSVSYALVDGRVSAEEANNEWIYYRYDEAGELISLNYEDNEFFYVKNIQGNDGNPVFDFLKKI